MKCMSYRANRQNIPTETVQSVATTPTVVMSKCTTRADGRPHNMSALGRQSCSSHTYSLSLWLIGTVRAEPETVISRAWVQSPDPAE